MTTSIRIAAVAAIVGAVLAAASEVVETVGGGYSAASFALLIAGRIGLGVAPWGLHRAQGGGRVSAVGAVVLAVGQFLFAAVEVVAWGSRTEAEVVARTGSLYWAAVVFFLVGTLVFGLGVLLSRRFPAWSGIVLLAGAAGVAVGGALVLTTVISVSNLLLDVVFAVLGWFVLRAGAAVLQGESGGAGR